MTTTGVTTTVSSNYIGSAYADTISVYDAVVSPIFLEGGGGNDNDECMGDGAEASTRQQDAVDAGDGLAVLAGHWEQPWDGAAVPEQGAMGGMGAMDAEGLLW